MKHVFFSMGTFATLTNGLLFYATHRANIEAGRSGDTGDRLAAAEFRGALYASTAYCVAFWLLFIITAL